MKLYTEEQVREVIERAELNQHLTYADVLDGIFPIKIPTDEEVEQESNNEYQEQNQSYENSVEMFPIDFANYLKVGFVDGAKWMRNKIQRGEQ
jgi:hypothetical protein